MVRIDQRTKRWFTRGVVSLVYHTYPESSGRGHSSCHFTLGEVFGHMGGAKNANLTHEAFDEDAMNATDYVNMLRRVEQRARGKFVIRELG